MNVTAIVPAAGVGKRFGKNDKPFVRLCGIPILIRTLKALERSKDIDRIILIVRPKFIRRSKKLLHRFRIKKVQDILGGGPTRTRSVFNGLRAVKEDCDLILIHDGARPLVTQDIIKKSIKAAKRFSAVCTVVPVKPTLKLLDPKDFISSSPNRNSLWEAQTPQVFSRDLIIKAYKKSMKEGIVSTDDSILVERLGIKVKVVRGSYRNIKITTHEDFRLAEVFLEKCE